MGENKALLTLGGRTYLERIAAELCDFREKLLSGGEEGLAKSIGFRHVPDELLNSGPMGGIYSALRASASDALFVVACDMPFFSAALARALISEIRDTDDALIFEDISGRAQPLCGLYRKRCAPVLGEHIQSGCLKMSALSDALRVRCVRLPKSISENTLRNINYREDIPE